MSYMRQLKDQRDLKEKEMRDILEGAKTENRAMTEEEQQKWDALDKEIKNIDKTIEAETRAIEMNGRKKDHGKAGGAAETEEQKKEREAMEERAFVDYVLGRTTEERAEGQLTVGENGAVIPVHIANRIIEEAKKISPIFRNATSYRMKGDLRVPVYDETADSIRMAYAEDFAELEAHAGTFTSVDLKGHLAGALATIGRRLENNASFNVTDFIVKQMAKAVARFAEKEMLNGTQDKMQGALETTNIVTAGSATAVTADDLIKMKARVPEEFQENAYWTMSQQTFETVQLLKDGNDRYLLQDDITNEFPFRLLGKPVHVSINMPDIATGKTPILFGDMSGMSTNVREDAEVQVLRELYATKHAIGVVTWLEMDSKITDKQAFVVLKMA